MNFPVFESRRFVSPATARSAARAALFSALIALGSSVGSAPLQAQTPTPASAPTPAPTATSAPVPTPTRAPKNAKVIALQKCLSEFGAWSHWNQVRQNVPLAAQIVGQSESLSQVAGQRQLVALQALTATLKSHPLKASGWYGTLVSAANDATAPDKAPAPTSALAALISARNAVATDKTARNTGLNLVIQADGAIETFKAFRALSLGSDKDAIKAAVADAVGVGVKLVGAIKVPDGLAPVAPATEVGADAYRKWLGGTPSNRPGESEAGKLPLLATAIRHTLGLNTVFQVLKVATDDLPSVTGTKDKVTTALDTLDKLGDDKSKVSAIATLLKDLSAEKKYFAAVRGDAEAQVPKVAQFVGKLQSDTRPSLEGGLMLGPIVDVLAQLRVMQRDWAGVKAANTNADFTASIRASDIQLRQMLVSQQLLSNVLELAEDDLSGDTSQWVPEQVRLFYFSDVRNLLQILNSDVETINGEDSASAFTKAAQLRAQLRDSDSNLSAALGELNNARSRAVSIREELRQSRADKKDKILRFERADKLFKKLPIGDERIEAQQTNVTNALNAKNAADERDAELQDESSGLSERLSVAMTGLRDAQKTVLELRRQAAPLAEDEVEAFARARDLRAMWRTRIHPDSLTPSRKIRIYAFDDSKTLLLYGPASAVKATKEIIAGFDRPAPQARITLWTLQLNSVSANDVNDALGRIDHDLRNLRGNVILVQDLLRNSINKEVNRQERIAYKVSYEAYKSKVKGGEKVRFRGVYKDRIARSFYYPSEIRHQLGLPGRLPDVQEDLVTASEELQLSLQYLQRADVKNRAAVSYRRGSDERQKRLDRNNLLRYAGYHFLQGLFAVERIEPEKLAQLTDLESRKAIARAYVHELTALIQKGSANDGDYADLFEKPSKFEKIAKDTVENDISKLTGIEYHKGFIAFGRETVGKLQTALDASWDSDDLNDIPGAFDLQRAENVTRFTLPDPAQGTTLGEMMFVLSLGKRRSRERILDNLQLALGEAYDNAGGTDGKNRNDALDKLLRFNKSLNASYGDADEPGQLARSRDISSSPQDYLYPNFPRTVMGSFQSRVPGEGDNHEMTSNQLEVFTAVQTKARANVAAEVKRLLRAIGTTTTAANRSSSGAVWAGDSAVQSLRVRYLPLAAWLEKKSLGISNAKPRNLGPNTGNDTENNKSRPAPDSPRSELTDFARKNQPQNLNGFLSLAPQGDAPPPLFRLVTKIRSEAIQGMTGKRRPIRCKTSFSCPIC